MVSRLRRALVARLLRLAPRWTARRVALDAHELGRLGEELAARHLVASGWRIRARRWNTGCGEIDLVGVEPATGALVCVEVKTRRAPALPVRRGAPRDDLADGARPPEPRDGPHRHLRHPQTRRLGRAARAVGAVRVDLIEIGIAPGRDAVLRHVVGVAAGRHR